MRAQCFECEQLVEAPDVESLAQAFVDHGRQNHTWDYPETSVRAYARNYGEAVERSTGSTQRLPAIAPPVVRRVTPDLVDDWLRFFDHDAFPDNPGWASCYCLDPHDPPGPEEPERPWRGTRSVMQARLASGQTVGYLAYVDGHAAGWLNASLRSTYRKYGAAAPGDQPERTIGISCFVIAPPYRRHGVSQALLDQAIADAASRGARWVEAYPHKAPEAGDAGHFRGSRSMFERRGFVPAEEREHFLVMRKPVE